MDNPLFCPASFFLVRFAIWPYQKYEALLSKPEWIEAIFALYDNDPLFREAILVASPSLAYSCKIRKKFQIHACAVSLLNYALRMSTRATPFGLFAPIATGIWNETTQLAVELKNVGKRARPDLGFIFDSIETLYKNLQNLPSLAVRSNPLAWHQNNRLYLAYFFEKSGHAERKKTGSIKASKLVSMLFDLASKPIKVSDLLLKVTDLVPHVDANKCLKLINDLLSSQFLIPALLPSLFSAHDDLKLLNPTFADLFQSIKTYNQSLVGQGEDILLKQLTDHKSSPQPLLQVDSFYKGSAVQLPKLIGASLGQAAELLWKLSVIRPKLYVLEDYRQKFLEKYGVDRIVPLLEVLSEEKGIGPHISGNFQPNPKNTQWEQWITKIWERAIYEHKKEIVLDDNDFSKLFSQFDQKIFDVKAAPNSFDVFAKIINLDQNKPLLEFCSAGPGGTLTFGRFADILDSESHEKIKTFLKKEEALEQHALFMDVSYWPYATRTANVATSPSYRAYRLDINGKNQAAGDLTLNDIYVGATLDRFFLTVKDGSAEINAHVTNRLNLSFAPDPIQFMLLVTNEKTKPIEPFSWGQTAEYATFFPRVRYKNTLISLATWNLYFEDCSKNSPEHVLAKFDTWCNQWQLPTTFFWAREDQLLLLDASHPAHRKQIADQIIAGKKLQFKEFIKHAGVQSLEGEHATEIVVPYKKELSASADSIFIPKEIPNISIQDRSKVPGSEWLYIKFYIGNESENSFLLNQLTPFTERIEQQLGIQDWFFLRYKDSHRHLRVRFHLPSAELFNSFLMLLKEDTEIWIEKGYINHLTIDTYEREIEKYGGVTLLPYVEQLFCSDSKATVALLDAFDRKQFKVSKEVFEVLSIAKFIQELYYSATDAHALLKTYTQDKTLLIGSREHKKQISNFIFELFSQSNMPPSRHAELFLHAEKLRANSITHFIEHTKTLPSEKLKSVVKNIIHMHANRLGCDHLAESRALLLICQTLEDFLYRSTKKSTKV